TMNPASAEYQVAFNYVEWIADLPWSRITPDRLEGAEGRRVLDEDHHGLGQPKKPPVEYIPGGKPRRRQSRPNRCLAAAHGGGQTLGGGGRGGGGKTAVGGWMAGAPGRQFVRISLGGVQDEAEIRGHRRTYVGALPGRLVAGLKKANSCNPVFVLDEVDKMS